MTKRKEIIANLEDKAEIKSAKFALRKIRAEIAIARTAQQIKVAEANNALAIIKFDLLKAIEEVEKGDEINKVEPAPEVLDNSNLKKETPVAKETVSEPEIEEEVPEKNSDVEETPDEIIPEELPEPEVYEDDFADEPEVYEDDSTSEIDEDGNDFGEPELIDNETVQEAVKHKEEVLADNSIVEITDINSDLAIAVAIAEVEKNSTIKITATTNNTSRIFLVIVNAIKKKGVKNFIIEWDKENTTDEWRAFKLKTAGFGISIKESVKATEPKKNLND